MQHVNSVTIVVHIKADATHACVIFI